MKVKEQKTCKCSMLFFMGLCLSGYYLYAANDDNLSYHSFAIQKTVYSVTQAKFKVAGIVKDTNGEPIIGATVVVKNENSGVLTDMDGYFSIDVPDKNAVLLFSFLGFDPKEVSVNGKSSLVVVMDEDVKSLEEVVVVGYGMQKKETLTGAISGIKGDALLKSPNASISNSLAGSVPGISSIQNSGEPGADDAQIFVRGVGSLTTDGATPLILVDGVERGFFQMDPNEIESISVLKDASATAVFGVRGANGVILVTTKRGVEGKPKISLSSSVGMQTPTRVLDIADSYTHAIWRNEFDRNNGVAEENFIFKDYDLERFRLGDEPIMYPNTDWYDYLTKKFSVQTQHNLNISGGTKDVKYFISFGFLFQDGFFKNIKEFGYDNNYKYNRYNYRANLDMNLSKTTVLKLNIGGVVGQKNAPNYHEEFWSSLLQTSYPFSSPGIVDGKKMVTASDRFGGMVTDYGIFNRLGTGYSRQVSNTMNFDLVLTQNLDFVTKGLTAEVKGAYNTTYSYSKDVSTSMITYVPFYYSTLHDPGISIEDPNFNKEVVYQTAGRDGDLYYSKGNTGRARDWYFETSLRYQRNFCGHDVGGMILYNQSKEYYPKQYTAIPTAYVGLVSRLTYNYQSRYMAEFNIGYNGSENFSPEKRFGTFPAGSVGYVLTEEPFWKKNKWITYLKLRASVGLVGNDNMQDYRYLYLPDGYVVDKLEKDNAYKDYLDGYNFGLGNTVVDKGADESSLANPNVTWETALKQNYGMDVNLFDDCLRLTFDYFIEKRKDILIKRETIPVFTSLSKNLLPAVNMGKVNNRGYEISLKWNDSIDDFIYWVDANVSYAKNKIIFQDEVEPNEPYQWRTGNSVDDLFGYVTERFYTEDDFDENGNLKEGLPKPSGKVVPGDLKYKDLNNDNVIDRDDVCRIGNSKTPLYTFGLNFGIEYRGFFVSMNWTGAKEANVMLQYAFQHPFDKNQVLYQFMADGAWTPERGASAKYPRLSNVQNNYEKSTTWMQDASYLRLKNATIGYNFTNKPWLDAIGASALSLKLTGYNLLTVDSLNFMDPESTPSRALAYPIMKIYSLGLNLTF